MSAWRFTWDLHRKPIGGSRLCPRHCYSIREFRAGVDRSEFDDQGSIPDPIGVFSSVFAQTHQRGTYACGRMRANLIRSDHADLHLRRTNVRGGVSCIPRRVIDRFDWRPFSDHYPARTTTIRARWGHRLAANFYGSGRRKGAYRVGIGTLISAAVAAFSLRKDIARWARSQRVTTPITYFGRTLLQFGGLGGRMS